MLKKRAKGLRNLERFGEMCMVTTKENPSKISDKGTFYEFVGYAVYHADDVYRHLNPKTKVSSNQEMSCG
jgi:hypothetical protein